MTDTNPTQPPDENLPDQLIALINQTRDPTIPRPVRWSDLTPTEAADHLTTLATWVDWLQDRYQLDQTELPTNWWQHGPLIEELSALKGAWDIAYDPTQDASAPATWHHTFHTTRKRLRQWTHHLNN
jgi:hypothetical protein